MKRWPYVVPLVAVLAAGAWFAFLRTDGGGASEPEVSSHEEARAEAPQLATAAPRMSADTTDARAAVEEPPLPPPPEGTKEIHGRVEDPSGKGIADVQISLQLFGRPRNLDVRRMKTTTAADGRFRLPGLPGGTYVVHALATAAYFPDKSIRVEAGGAPVLLRVFAYVPLRLTVLDWRGTTLRGALVKASSRRPGAPAPTGNPFAALSYESNAGPASGTTGLDGRIDLSAVDYGGTWGVTLSGPMDRDDMRDTTIDPWDPAQETVRLERAYVIHGVVQHRAGVALPEAILSRRVGGDWKDVRVLFDGTFDIRGLVQGPVVLRATLAGVPVVADAPCVTIEAGNEHAVIEIDAGAELLLRIEDFADSPHGIAYLTQEPAKEGIDGSIRIELSTKGEARVRGLNRDATYTLVVPPIEGRGIYRKGVRATDSPLAVKTADGKPVQVRIFNSAGKVLNTWGDDDFRARPPRLLGPGLSWSASINQEERAWFFPNVPDGTWRVVAEIEYDEGPPLVGEATVEAGGTAEIRLGPAAAPAEPRDR